MNIVRYNPFRELRGLQDEMNRIFTSVAPVSGDREELFGGAWSPRVDIFENKDSLVLEAELPGMKREDFELSFENNVLTLSGERKFEKKTDEDNYHRVERAYGSFTRSFTLAADGNGRRCKSRVQQRHTSCKLCRNARKQRLARSRSQALMQPRK